MAFLQRSVDATLHPEQAACDGRVDMRFLPADDAAEQHMRLIGCNEAFELGSVKCERRSIDLHVVALHVNANQTVVCCASTPLPASLMDRGILCQIINQCRLPRCRLSKTVAFVLQYLGQRWAAPAGTALVLLPPAGQTVIDAGSFWSAAGHPGLSVRPSDWFQLSARQTGRTASTPCMMIADTRVRPIRTTDLQYT